MRTRFIETTLVAVTAAGVVMCGCADIPRKAETGRDVVSAYRIDADDQPAIKVTTAAGVNVSEDEKEHFRRVVTDKLNARRTRNAADGDPKKCEVDVTLTRFEKGSKFTRVMSGNLGQIHLDANVVVVPAGGGDRLNAFRLSKTFAWVGFYGASEDIEDIELPFADAIAAALTGQPSEPDMTIVAGDPSKS